MRKILFILVTVLVGGFLFFVSQPARAADGAAVYKQYECYKCHGNDAEGSEIDTGGPKLKGSKYVAENSKEEIKKVILDGRKGPEKKYKQFLKKMPAYKDKMSDEELEALTKFLKAG